MNDTALLPISRLLVPAVYQVNACYLHAVCLQNATPPTFIEHVAIITWTPVVLWATPYTTVRTVLFSRAQPLVAFVRIPSSMPPTAVPSHKDMCRIHFAFGVTIISDLIPSCYLFTTMLGQNLRPAAVPHHLLPSSGGHYTAICLSLGAFSLPCKHSPRTPAFCGCFAHACARAWLFYPRHAFSRWACSGALLERETSRHQTLNKTRQGGATRAAYGYSSYSSATTAHIRLNTAVRSVTACNLQPISSTELFLARLFLSLLTPSLPVWDRILRIIFLPARPSLPLLLPSPLSSFCAARAHLMLDVPGGRRRAIRRCGQRQATLQRGSAGRFSGLPFYRFIPQNGAPTLYGAA